MWFVAIHSIRYDTTRYDTKKVPAGHRKCTRNFSMISVGKFELGVCVEECAPHTIKMIV